MMCKRCCVPAMVAALAMLVSVCTLGAADKDGFDDAFDVRKSDFASTGKNDYFILEPGYQHFYEGTDEGKPATLVITVLNETKTVDGVETRIVEERETLGGEVIEVSRNYFALDKATGDVYYFGEDVDEYKDGKVHGHPGSWLSGKDGAHFGLFMPAKPTVGQKFYQEIAPKVAMDRCEVVSLSEKETVPAGEFEKCLKMKETTPLEPDTTEYKLYAPSVGLIVDGPVKLVKHGPKGAAKPAAKTDRRTKKAGPEPVVPLKDARDALAAVGADPDAVYVWLDAINDPNMSAHDRSDLIEDLNEHGFPDPKNLTQDDLPLVINRLALIEQVGPDAMDETNAAAFAEAYKDLVNMARKLMD